MSRGLRNHNPGNIRQSLARFHGEVRPSTDPAFKQFESAAWGYRAIFVVLDNYRRRHRLTTIAQMIARWAPPTENHTTAYIDSICRQTGIGPAEEIDTRDAQTMIPLVAAISLIENGCKADPHALEEGWRLFCS